MIYTYQDFEEYRNSNRLIEFLGMAIRKHMDSPEYKMAKIADEYDRQQDVTVIQYTKLIADKAGPGFADVTSANNRISSNFFHRLNTQRCAYSLGNGIDFQEHAIKERLGADFDNTFYKLAYKALIHRECFGFWNVDKLYMFPITEFVPFYDEETSALRAGIRFWQLAKNKPVTAVLYMEEGYVKYRSKTGTGGYDFELIEDLKPYIVHIASTPAGGDEVTGTENYSTLPIIRMKGSDLYQSTLVGMRERIDSFDLIQSGFANDLQDCAQIYWIIENCGGMDEEDLQEFLNRIKTKRIVTADTQSAGIDRNSLQPYVQDVPYESRMAYLDHIRKAIYEDFGALDVHAVSANSTNDHLDAAYQPMDENADDFEYQCIDFIRQLLALMGIEGENAIPIFKRNRIVNQREQVEMILLEAEHLDEETILNLLPNITPDMQKEILKRKDAEEQERFKNTTELEGLVRDMVQQMIAGSRQTEEKTTEQTEE